MSTPNPPTPRFDELIESGDPDRARLEQAHELLVAAGSPPELPPSLHAPPPEPQARVVPMPRRRYTAIAAVAIAAVVLVAVGYAVGARNSPDPHVQTVAMTGPAGATGSIGLQPKDAAGNWPMTLEVEGLPPLPDGATYSLWLTRNGELADTCGEFVVGRSATTVPLNAPYSLRKYDGWVVVKTGSREPFVLRTSTV
jgi:hypothetical protein